MKKSIIFIFLLINTGMIETALCSARSPNSPTWGEQLEMMRLMGIDTTPYELQQSMFINNALHSVWGPVISANRYQYDPYCIACQTGLNLDIFKQNIWNLQYQMPWSWWSTPPAYEQCQRNYLQSGMLAFADPCSHLLR